MGEFVQLTLSYNTGAAFGIGAGAYSRWILMALTLGAIGIIARLYRDAKAQEGVCVLSLGLVMGGAVGNLINRIWSERGVVDFLDVGLGASAGQRSTWLTSVSASGLRCMCGHPGTARHPHPDGYDGRVYWD